jgi:hypothetical protein
MTAEERELASGLIIFPNGKRRVSPDEFVRRFPSALVGGKVNLSLLEEACRRQNADDLGAAFVIGAVFGFPTGPIPLLCQLLSARWHQHHEGIVQTLQELRAAAAVDALYDTALDRHEYLAYDEFFGLARKCTWALADIGTQDALAKLHLLAGNENAIIAGYAQKRINNWDEERARKGA